MSFRMLAGCSLTLISLVVMGCSNKPPRLYAPSINASAAGKAAIEEYDKDQDGAISGAELDACPALKAAMAQIDTTGSGAITAAQITARIKAWQDSKLGRTSLSCRVLHNGKPLADAEVKFVPEKFLGENMTVASGKTDQRGMAMISVAEVDATHPAGLPPGLYRVEITKAGENIPAKYNTQTTLGQEVALDAAGLREGLQFDLQY